MKPTVTELLDILNKPALIKWANDLGLKGISLKSYRKDVFSDGNKKHKEIEDYLLHGVLIEDENKRIKIEKSFSDVSLISIEESFENDFFKGRCDIRFIKNGIQYIGDFKRKFKRPYLEHYLQLIAYKIHFNCDKICIIDLNEFMIHELSLLREYEYKKILHHLIEIYKTTKTL
jgi:hypothetical protein